MGKPFKLSLVSDVRDFLKGTKSVEDSLEAVAESLDDVSTVGENVEESIEGAARSSARALDKLSDEAKDTGKKIDKGLDRAEDAIEDIGKESEKSERRFSDAAKIMRDAAEKTGRSIGDDINKGTDEAGEGVSELKEEAVDSAREMAASFQGGADDIADLLQEVAANALKGFGPAGMAAGIAAAVGIGYLISSLQESAEEAQEAKEAAIELADEINEVGGNPAALDWAEKLREKLFEIVNEKSWYEFWQDSPETRLEQWTAAAEKWGFTIHDATRAVTGDKEALKRVQDALNRSYEDEKHAAREAVGSHEALEKGVTATAYAHEDAAKEIQAFREEFEKQLGVTDEAAGLNAELANSLSAISDAANEAQQATTTYEESVVESLTNAGESFDKYLQDGVFNLEAYNAAIEEQAAAIQSFEDNLVTASSNLSAEALNYIKSLGPDAAPLLQAFINAPLEEKQRTAQNWDTIGRAATDGYKQSLKLEEKTREATSAAQKVAAGAPITFTTKLSTSTLQREINWAASTLNVPVIEIPVRTKKVLD